MATVTEEDPSTIILPMVIEPEDDADDYALLPVLSPSLPAHWSPVPSPFFQSPGEQNVPESEPTLQLVEEPTQESLPMDVDFSYSQTPTTIASTNVRTESTVPTAVTTRYDEAPKPGTVYQVINMQANGVVKNLMVPMQQEKEPQINSVVLQYNNGRGESMNIMAPGSSNVVVRGGMGANGSVTVQPQQSIPVSRINQDLPALTPQVVNINGVQISSSPAPRSQQSLLRPIIANPATTNSIASQLQQGSVRLIPVTNPSRPGAVRIVQVPPVSDAVDRNQIKRNQIILLPNLQHQQKTGLVKTVVLDSNAHTSLLKSLPRTGPVPLSRFSKSTTVAQPEAWRPLLGTLPRFTNANTALNPRVIKLASPRVAGLTPVTAAGKSPVIYKMIPGSSSSRMVAFNTTKPSVITVSAPTVVTSGSSATPRMQMSHRTLQKLLTTIPLNSGLVSAPRPISGVPKPPLSVGSYVGRTPVSVTTTNTGIGSLGPLLKQNAPNKNIYQGINVTESTDGKSPMLTLNPKLHEQLLAQTRTGKVVVVHLGERSAVFSFTGGGLKSHLIKRTNETDQIIEGHMVKKEPEVDFHEVKKEPEDAGLEVEKTSFINVIQDKTITTFPNKAKNANAKYVIKCTQSEEGTIKPIVKRKKNTDESGKTETKVKRKKSTEKSDEIETKVKKKRVRKSKKTDNTGTGLVIDSVCSLKGVALQEDEIPTIDSSVLLNEVDIKNVKTQAYGENNLDEYSAPLDVESFKEDDNYQEDRESDPDTIFGRKIRHCDTRPMFGIRYIDPEGKPVFIPQPFRGMMPRRNKVNDDSDEDYLDDGIYDEDDHEQLDKITKKYEYYNAKDKKDYKEVSTSGYGVGKRAKRWLSTTGRNCCRFGCIGCDILPKTNARINRKVILPSKRRKARSKRQRIFSKYQKSYPDLMDCGIKLCRFTTEPPDKFTFKVRRVAMKSTTRRARAHFRSPVNKSQVELYNKLLQSLEDSRPGYSKDSDSSHNNESNVNTSPRSLLRQSVLAKTGSKNSNSVKGEGAETTARKIEGSAVKTPPKKSKYLMVKTNAGTFLVPTDDNQPAMMLDSQTSIETGKTTTSAKVINIKGNNCGGNGLTDFLNVAGQQSQGPHSKRRISIDTLEKSGADDDTISISSSNKRDSSESFVEGMADMDTMDPNSIIFNDDDDDDSNSGLKLLQDLTPEDLESPEKISEILNSSLEVGDNSGFSEYNHMIEKEDGEIVIESSMDRIKRLKERLKQQTEAVNEAKKALVSSKTALTNIE